MIIQSIEKKKKIMRVRNFIIMMSLSLCVTHSGVFCFTRQRNTLRIRNNKTNK
jgi:hypothetical protein